MHFPVLTYALGARGREFESRCPDRKTAQNPAKNSDSGESPSGKERLPGAICGSCLWQRLWQRAGLIPDGRSLALTFEISPKPFAEACDG